VVGEGWHRAAGEPHAEVLAIAGAGPAAAGATLYVTLEPCAHQGRTPPCAEAVVAAGVGRVVAALIDPDPLVAGRGVARLRAAGIPVELGDGAEAAAEQNAAFLVHRRLGRPRITVKGAASLDGKVAAADRTSKWITGPEARADGHRLRAAADAVMVGSGTALADDPQLTARPPGGAARQPLRVLLDSAGSVPAGAGLFDAGAPTLVATTGRAPAGTRRAWEAAGAEVLVLPQGRDGRVGLAALAAELGGRGLLEVLVEGGPTVQGALWAAGLVDRLVWYLAPIVLGGDGALGLVAGPGVATLGDAYRVRPAAITAVGADLRIEAHTEAAVRVWAPEPGIPGTIATPVEEVV
jgi:diaminohydroxyphosphoribosylaminopyrimidine deaminase/5-amino-6-(5-phosphoribosylamino)uracil reductase